MTFAQYARDVRGTDTQEVFARRMGKTCTVVTVSRWENGVCEPDERYAPKLARLAKARGVTQE